MPGEIRSFDLNVTLGGSTIGNAYAARVSLGYDMSYGTAQVDIAGEWPGGNFWDDVNIFVDGEHWFSGILTAVDYNFYPRSISMQCRGRMWFLEQTMPPGEISQTEGYLLQDITGGPASDEAIVSTVLGIAGVDTNGGSIGGTGVTLGTVAPEEFSWRANESALSYVQRIDQISLGFRTFESTGGQVYRRQISTFPDSGAEMQFTEGVDITEATNNRSFQESYDAVRVSGYAVGDFLEPRVYVAGGGSHLFSFNSPMIERANEGSPGAGISCQALAEYWLGELDRVLVKMRMTTPRNGDIGPGQVHNIQAGSRLGHSGDLWVQRVDKEYAADGRVSHTMTYVGGG